MSQGTEEYRLQQIHIDAARNATDDFNPFHDPNKWDAVRNNPFGATIALGFQLESLIEYRISLLRESEGATDLITREDLRFANFQVGFADVVRPDEGFGLDIRPTVERITDEGRISNRVVLRKNRRPVVMGFQHETRAPLFLADADPGGFGELSSVDDRSFVGNGGYFLKRKFMNTSNAKNFLAGSLVDQHYYFDELEDRVRFPAIFPAALLSCALLEKSKMEGYDFFRDPMVYTSHELSIDRILCAGLSSNDRLHLLVQGPVVSQGDKGLGKADIPQTGYRCYGLLEHNQVLFRGKVQMALLRDVIRVKSGRAPAERGAGGI